MELRPTFTQTEAGLLPADWALRPLSLLADKIMVGIASAATHAYRAKGIPLFRNQNIKAGHLDDSDLLFVSPEYEVAFKNKRLRGGDLLTARTGYPGTTCVVPLKYEAAQSFTTLITRPRPETIDSTYLCHYINSEQGQKFFEQSQIGGAQKNVNAGALRKMPVPTPSLPEQRAISTALTDMDALLAGLDRLTTKKRDLKQAAMQQLLTGQTRLPGFQGQWEVKRLGDILTICHGRNQREVEDADGSYPILATGGQIGTASRALYDKPSVLIGRKGTINQPRYMDTPFWTVDTLFYSAMKADHNAKFLYYRFCLIDWMQYNEASGVPSLNSRTIENVEVSVPAPAEQSAIAAVISDMDAELAALDTRRDKTRALKQGMMKELLTGRTRLV